MLRLSALYVWRNVVNNGYLPLESFLSTQEVADECVLCVDPDYPEDMRLAQRLCEVFPKARIVEFRWPENVPGDGSRIGIASQYGLDHCSGNYVLNVQADEVYSPELKNWIRDNWRDSARRGLECMRFKVLNLEHNMQQYQGGDEGSTWNWQKGAGYNCAVKLFRRCPAIKFAHDGWSMEGCSMLYHPPVSEAHPVVHCHDNFRDTLVNLRQTAANEIWTDRSKFGNYKESADNLEQSRDAWWNDPVWTQTDSRFAHLLPDYVKPLIGKTKYEVRYSLLDDYVN